MASDSALYPTMIPTFTSASSSRGWLVEMTSRTPAAIASDSSARCQLVPMSSPCCWRVNRRPHRRLPPRPRGPVPPAVRHQSRRDELDPPRALGTRVHVEPDLDFLVRGARRPLLADEL